MSEEFPYQLVSFIDQEPAIGEPVYGGDNGWYPQIALKRRFAVEDLSEADMVSRIAEFCAAQKPLQLSVGGLIKPDRMPVHVLEVEPSPELIGFHHDFIRVLGRQLISRFPERDGDNYYPHITAEYDGKTVIDSGRYINRQFSLKKVWLLKDDTNTRDSRAHISFDLVG